MHKGGVMKKLSSFERWKESVKAGNGGSGSMFALLPQFAEFSTAVKEARLAAKPELPSPGQLALLAALVSDKDQLFQEYDRKVAKLDADLKLTSVEKAMRRAMHFYFMARNELRAADALDAIDLAMRYHDWGTAHALNDELNMPRMEAEAWRFYPNKTDDDLRQFVRAELRANGDNKAEFKSEYGLPTALKKWRLATVGGATQKTVKQWWKERWRSHGGYYAVYRWEVNQFIEWRIKEHRKKNAAGVARSRGKRPLKP